MTASTEPIKGAKISRLLLAALLLIVALGATLRIHKLGTESIWLDEAYSLKFAHGSLSSIAAETAKDVHPPLYYFALHYWMELFGDSEFSVRLLSTLFGLLAIAAIYRLAALLFDRATGLLAALLLALSHFHIEFSQEARMYTLFTLLCLLSIYFFIRLLEDGNFSALAGYIISSAALSYTHVYSFFILAAQNIFFLSLLFTSREIFRRRLKIWMLAEVSLFVLFLPWLSVLMRQVSQVQRGFWIPKYPLAILRDTLVIYAGSAYLAWIFFPLVAVALFVGLRGPRGVNEHGASAGRKSFLSPRLKTYFLLLWLACPVILPFIISRFMSPIFLPKYTITASLAFLILAARGFLSGRFHQLRMLLILLVACFSLIDLRDYYRTPRKDVWREAVANFEKMAKPNDLVLFNHESSQVPFDYYLKRTDLIEKPFPEHNSEMKRDQIAELLRRSVEGHERVWLVLSHQSELSPLVVEQLKEWYDPLAHLTDPGVEMYLFEKRE